MWKKTDDPKSAFDDAQQGGERTMETPRAAAPRPGSGGASPQPASRQPASIGPSITIRGDITGEEDLIVHGRIEGTLTLPDNDIIVGSDGQVKANLNATKLLVEGRVIGDLSASERVVIKKSGQVEGNITAPRVVLEDGCRFKGSVEMNMDSGSSASSSASRASVEKKTDSNAKVTGMPAGDGKVAHASSGT